MVDVIGTVTANIVPRAVRSNSALEVEPVSESAPSQSSTSNVGATGISSHIRVDNLLDIAILEVRDSDTGNVIQQYPTEPQIKAFQRASELELEQQVEASQVEVTSSERQEASTRTSDVSTADVVRPSQQSSASVDVPQTATSSPAVTTATSIGVTEAPLSSPSSNTSAA